MDVTIKNMGDEKINFTPGNLVLYDRMEDDTYVSEGFADKRIEMLSPGLVDYYGQNIDNASGNFDIMAGEAAEIRIVYLLREEYLSHTLCIKADYEDYAEYNEKTERYEPAESDNVKFIYIN